MNLLFIHLTHCFATTGRCFKNLKMIDKRCIKVQLEPILRIHNPKNIRDTMGWKPNFQLLHKFFLELLLNHTKTMDLHKHEFFLERNQQKETQKRMEMF